LMASALGAVGVFKVLGNTLRFFFLPSALDVLDAMLDFQDFMMGIDEETRRTIGTIFIIITALAVLIGIAAALGKALITVFGGLQFIGGLLLKVAGFIMKLGKAISLIVQGGLSTILPFLAGVAGAFLVVVGVAKKFGKVVALVVAGILIAIGALVAAVASIPVVVAAAVGVIVGAILGLIWTFRDTIVGAVQWIVNKIVGFFEWLYNVLVGNSIIPDMVNSIIDWLFKLPGQAYDMATSMVNNIIDGIKGVGSGIWNAFKKVLPDFLVDALEKGGQAVKGIVDATGDVVGKAGNALGNVAGSISLPDLGGGGNNNNGTTVQNNQMTANVTIDGKQETDRETGRRVASGMRDELNNQTGNTTSGT